MKISPVNYQYNTTYKNFVKKQPATNVCAENFYTNKSLKYPAFAKSSANFNKRKEYYSFLSSNPTPIAQGTDGVIYKRGNEAIKIAKTEQTSFAEEAQILKRLPINLSNGQKFIDRFSYGGKDVLVSSFVDGEHKQALELGDISKLYDVLLKHDKANIMHGDLNLGNIVFTKDGNISLIDYGTASIPQSTKVDLYPDFVINTNALKFENTGLNDTLKNLSTDKQLEFFKGYLSQKAAFYEKHVQFVKNTYPEMTEAIEYEENLAKVLANPSEEIVEMELRRITTLDFLEQADTATNYEHNPHKSINLWNATVESAKESIKYSHDILKGRLLSSEERKYFENQRKIAQNFYTTLTEWKAGTFDWLYQIKEPYFMPKTEAEKRIKETWGEL